MQRYWSASVRRVWRCCCDEGGMQAAEKLAVMVAVLALLGALGLTLASQGGAVGESSVATVVRLIGGAPGQPGAGEPGAQLAAIDWLEPGQAGGAVLALPAAIEGGGEDDGGGFWLSAALGFVATLAVGLVAAVVVGGLLLVLSAVSAKLALVVGAVLLTAALAYLMYTRGQQFAAEGAPWYAYPLLLPLAISDLIGLTGVIEGLTRRDIVSGAPLSAEEAGERFGSGLAGVLLTLATAGAGRAARLRSATRVSGWLERVRIKQPNGDVLGWGNFDISFSKLWRTKRSFTAWDKQVIQQISKRITQISQFDPRGWAKLSPAQQQRAARRLVAIVMEAHGIPRARYPKLDFSLLPGDDFGSAYWPPQWSRGILEINLNNSIGDVVGTIVHEGRHYFQYWQSYQRFVLGRDLAHLHPHTPQWLNNLDDYGGQYIADDLDPRYFTQPLEADAESFGRRIIDMLPARWPRPLTMPIPPVPHIPPITHP
ncbi:MAG TPA: hypothetical protein VFS21_14050 [Roseiflexaceae bacterium]|nr:hypothetical protein [Roseiflexaceae bacterium]